MSCNRKGKLYIHTAGISFYRCVNEIPDLRKFYDFLQLLIYFPAAHSQDGSIEIYVFFSGHFSVKASSHFKHRGYTAIQIKRSCCGNSYSGDQF